MPRILEDYELFPLLEGAGKKFVILEDYELFPAPGQRGAEKFVIHIFYGHYTKTVFCTFTNFPRSWRERGKSS